MSANPTKNMLIQAHCMCRLFRDDAQSQQDLRAGLFETSSRRPPIKWRKEWHPKV